jgi:Domain of unknown function (DUF5979)
MLRRFASVVAGGVLALASYSIMLAAPASAGPGVPFPNTVKVTKVVEGDSKGAGFQVEVTCEQQVNDFNESNALVNGTHSETLTFGPEGGTQEAKAPFNSTCTIIETHDGGSSKVEVSPSTCDFTVPLPVERTDAIEPETCEVTVTNTFEPPPPGPAGPAGPPGPPGPPGEAAAATAVSAQARFTG